MLEKKDKEIRVMIQPSLYVDFKKACKEDYKSISEVIRDMIVSHVKAYKNK